jgi:hypothetical protein
MGKSKRARNAARTPRGYSLFRSPSKKRGRQSAAQLKVLGGVAPKRYDAAKMRQARDRVVAEELSWDEAVEEYKRHGVKRRTLYLMIRGWGWARCESDRR